MIQLMVAPAGIDELDLRPVASNISAAVARGHSDIMPHPGFRKLTITLTIVVIVSHSSCGFTLNRKTTAEVIPGPSTDQASLESLHVQSIKRSNDIRQGKDDDTNKATKNKPKYNSEQKVFSTEATLDGIKETEKMYTTAEEMSTTFSEVTEANIVSEETTKESKTTANDNAPISRSTVSIPTSKIESTENVTEDETHATNSIDFTTVKIQTEAEKPKIEEKKPYFQNATDAKGRNEDEVNSTIPVPKVSDQIAIDSEANENLSSSKEPVTFKTTVPVGETETIETETEATSQTTSNLSSSSQMDKKPKSTSSEATTSSIPESSTSNKLKYESSELPEDTLKSSSTLVEVKVTKDVSITTEPNWKKYVTIERKRSGSSEESTSAEKDHDSVKAESIQTTLPIPSLEMSSEDLSNANHLTTISESQAGSVSEETESSPTSESVKSSQQNSPATLASKRAGFLDLSERISTYDQKASTVQNLSNRKMAKMETSETDSSEIKKLNDFKPQEQMAVDAMREEELLKEELMNNREENAKRYDEGKALSDNVKLALTTSQATVEDNLSVQPISQDRRTTLYTVGPNYKPMKRIEVQPAKPFIRDPDDNSWRNESISSLGIVFKPKNSSSKSFKEVLKTKTETEFNNVQDKDSKDETPELRERLEKITEVRKSKKKRIDNFGDVVYTDYEEGSSAEGTSTPEVETISTKINTTETPSTLSNKLPETEVTLPKLTTESERYWKKRLETISKQEMFKDLGLDILTTQKTRKPYNVAEYYDTTDEYDADYVSLPKIDLKKFTVSFKPSFPSLTSPPVTPPTTVVMPSRFPDRKPTVQYFPPTTKTPKVNMNNYDEDFERRVQLYTLKETPKTNPPFELSEPVATDRPQMRSTVKPSDFTMFTPQSPESMTKHMFVTNEPRVTDAYVMNDENFDKGTYVIKHYKDFLTDAAKEEEDRAPDFIPFAETADRGLTLDEAQATTKIKQDDFEYDSQFRRDVLSRFVDNFNHNSDRFKVDFPVLFNTSVVHRSNDEEGRGLASSRTFMRRLYGNGIATKPPGLMNRGCEPNCDNITVELSPAYELHYYVPEQEEKELAEQPATLSYRYKL